MKTIMLALISMLLVSSISYANGEDPGITPDSPLWGLDKALEQIELLLAAGDVEKAKIELKHAHERLLEVKVMIEQNKLEHAEKAKEAHREKVERIKESIDDIDADDEDAVEDEVEIEAEIEEQEQEIEEIENEIEIKIKGQLTAEQQAAIDALIASFRNSTGEVKIKIRIKRDEIKIKIKQKTGKSEDEVEDEFERHENRTGLHLLRKEKAMEQIEDAEEELNEVKQELAEEFGDNSTWPSAITSLLREAERHLANAKLAFEQDKFGEAYGQATAAEHIAENIDRRIDEFEEREDRSGRRDGNRTREPDDDEDDEEDEGERLGGEGIAGSSDVDVTGIVDYEGLPNPEGLQPVHGWRYFFTPGVEDQGDMVRLGASLDNRITLIGGQLSPELEQRAVRIKGTFVKDYKLYKTSRGLPITSADPDGQVVLVEELRIESG